MVSHQDTGLRPYLSQIGEVRRNWGWFLALGVLLVALGIAAISSSFYATVFSVIFFGFLLFFAGIVQFVQGFLARQWSGLFLSLLLGILYMVTGGLFIAKPASAAMGITLVIATLCLVGGLFKMISSLFIRFDRWGWVFFNGLITFILGLMIYSEWPISGLWVIGLFVGIDLILAGATWIFLSLGLRTSIR